MANALGKFLDRFYPSGAKTLRSVWYSLNGQRAKWMTDRQIGFAQAQFDRQVTHAQTLFNQQYVLDDGRFNDLKGYINTNIPNSGAFFPVIDSVQRLRQLGVAARDTVAVVTVVPPAQTGVAKFSKAAFGAAPFDVDVYGPFASPAEYLGAPAMAGTPTNMSFFAADSIAEGIQIRKYRAVIWVLANSDHNVPVLRLLRSLRHLPETIPTWIEIHDPLLLNVADKIARADRGSLAQLARPYCSRADTIDWSLVERGDYTPLLDTSFAGVRAMLNDVPFTGLIVHSAAAKQIVLLDWPDLDPDKIHVLYHPVFEPYRARQPRHQSGLRVGSFGVPAGGKLTAKIVAAHRQLRTTLPDATLVIAGYNAAEYARQEGLRDEPGLIIEDAPSDARLLAIMSSVDVAVQLRAFNTGESSGIVHQLCALDVPVLVSPVGAMNDFGAVACYVPPACTAARLAELILDEARDPTRRQAARAAFAQARTPARFCGDLLDLLAGRTPVRPEFVPGTSVSLEPNASAPEPAYWPQFERIMQETDALRNPYVRDHLRRYRHTLAALEAWMPAHRGAALELGTSWLFAILLKADLGFSVVDVTDRKPDESAKVAAATLPFAGTLQAFNLDLESELLPVEEARYDLVLCCEVLEHLDVDPMFMLAEINRTIKIGGRLLLTTPNVTSSRNVSKILNGYAPHFYMQYHKDRTPYRHNIEYAPDQVAGLLAAAGFRIDQLWTADTFQEPVPDALDLLQRLHFPTALRGDNIFAIATKVGAIVDRHPPIIYV